MARPLSASQWSTRDSSIRKSLSRIAVSPPQPFLAATLPCKPGLPHAQGAFFFLSQTGYYSLYALSLSLIGLHTRTHTHMRILRSTGTPAASSQSIHRSKHQAEVRTATLARLAARSSASGVVAPVLRCLSFSALLFRFAPTVLPAFLPRPEPTPARVLGHFL